MSYREIGEIWGDTGEMWHLEELHELLDHESRARGHLDPHAADGVDPAARDTRVRVGRILGHLLHDLGEVGRVGDGREDLELEQLHARGVVVPGQG